MSKRTLIKRTLLIATMLVLATVLALVAFAPDNEFEIRNGTLQYSQELGWINWDHARPDGPVEAYSRLQRLNDEATDSFSFTYRQKMVLPLVGNLYVAEVEELWKIRNGLTEEELKNVFLEVFVSVSNRFEEMQAHGAYAALAASRESSFREGDLIGNLLAFYAAVDGEAFRDFKRALSLFSIEKSLQQYRVQGTSVAKWDDVTLNCPGNNQSCTELNRLIDQVGQNAPQSRLVNGREGFFKK